MDVERALETQRMKLLRLLARWAVVLEILAGGPLALPVPRWVRAFIDTLLTRAEYAAQILVKVSGRLQSTSGLADPINAPRPLCPQTDDAPSVQALIRRIAALREMLENLPRHARRLLRVRIIACDSFDWSKRLDFTQARDRLVPCNADWIASKEARPPDKPGLFTSLVRGELPLLCGREAFRVV